MTTAPTADELLANPIVQQALDQAWIDSFPNDASKRREQGGWIYMDVSSGALTIRRAPAGSSNEINLDPPQIVLLSVVVAIFHTHPNPTAENWYAGPSQQDKDFDDEHGVPDLIATDEGTKLSGPSVRRQGLSGPAGFPLP